MHVHVTDTQNADAGTAVRPLCWKRDLPGFSFCWNYCCASLLGNVILLFLRFLDLRELPIANYGVLCQPSHKLAAWNMIGALAPYCCLLEYE